ncbi:MAG: SGNH/GDSL hydrolase family protein [Proteobacteria bacterium]|nr:SGNH/GDSL hydrolase family protein [Pseudomonadota bacterium]
MDPGPQGTGQPNRVRRWFEKVAKPYRFVAVLTLNTLVVFSLVNLVCWLIPPSTNQPIWKKLIQKHGLPTIMAAYPHMQAPEVVDLLRETWGRKIVYEPLTEFREPASSGRYVNVSEDGFRLHEGATSWPPPKNGLTIFVFGGSTTFGYGVADNETIPARLQHKLKDNRLRATVYNFGRGYYASTQERILFEKLITDGNVPKLAVFIDGINDSLQVSDHTEISADLNQSVRWKNGVDLDLTCFQRLPALRLIGPTDKGSQKAQLQQEAVRHEFGNGAPENMELLSGLVRRRYFNNIRMISGVSREYQIKPLFVWQPTPYFGYDRSKTSFEVDPSRVVATGPVYGQMGVWQAMNSSFTNFVWLADTQLGRKEPLYVDSIHYSAFFCDVIAGEIAARIKALGWLE